MNEHTDIQPVTERAQLIEWFAEKGKPKSAWRIGTEHEKFLFHKGTFKPVAYDGPARGWPAFVSVARAI